jgi:alkanesulfonate monooxygenase SsuD/methylene tetrahydromethanopterin reductase-like flavin-dependent oxidoreductase (luciferase family)
MEPVVVVISSWWPGIVASAAASTDSAVAGRIVVDVVRGRSVIVVGRWPPSENVVR